MRGLSQRLERIERHADELGAGQCSVCGGYGLSIALRGRPCQYHDAEGRCVSCGKHPYILIRNRDDSGALFGIDPTHDTSEASTRQNGNAAIE